MASPDIVGSTSQRNGIARFGVFELHAASGELRKQGARVRLQGKPQQVLLALLERPGEVVTRQELQRRLWPEDVFVDFEAGLNTAANRLRLTLGDSATSPHFIETLARTGYRFIGAVEWIDAPGRAAAIPDAHAASAPPEASAAHPTALPEGAIEAGSPDLLSPSASPGALLPGVMGSHERRGRVRPLVAAATALAATALALGLAFSLRGAEASALEFRPITFGRGLVWGARFSADGRDVLYSANWDVGPRQMYAVNASDPEARVVGFGDHRLVAIASTGEFALLGADGFLPVAGGTLFRARLGDPQPTMVARNVMAADWLPDGSTLAVARAVDGTNVLEFPSGTPRHTTSGWIGGIRVAPDGRRLAFVEHPVRNDNGGHVRLLDSAGEPRTLSEGWATVGGLGWHPTTGEIWFTASRDGSPKSLWAVTDTGTLRPIAKPAGGLTLRDVALDGRLLASSETTRLEMAALFGEAPQKNITLFDWSRVADISPDGQTVLFDETGAAGGADYLIYTHSLSTGTSTRVGEGRAMALSANGQLVLALGSTERTRLRLLPVQGGTARELPAAGLEYQWARYFPDGKSILALANVPGAPLRIFVQPPEGPPYPLTPPTMVRNVAISPDGANVALLQGDNTLTIYPVAPDSTPRLVANGQNLAPLLWTADDWLYVQRLGAYTQLPTELLRLHLPTGRIEPWRTIGPEDIVGVNALTKVMVSANERTVVFNYRRSLSELFVSGATGR